MKKILALLLAVVLCFSLCACGGKSGVLKEKNLINIEWYGILNHTVNGPSYINFEKDGTGSFVYYKNNNSLINFTWTIVDNTVKISTISGKFSTEKTLEYIKTENNVQLKQSDSNDIYVPKDNFESATKELKEKFISEAVVLDLKAAKNLKSSNEVKFKNEYIGKIYKYTGKVYEINERYCTMSNETYMGLPSNSIDIYLSPEELAELSKYSIITVVGTFSSYFARGSIGNAFILEE